MSFPKVSVIIPVYNPGDLLYNCLDSVKNQTMKDIEIICIDDGSTDNSRKILEDYNESDSRFKVFHQENLGAGTARNKGIEYSTGEFILFIDSDDFIEIDTCERLYQLAKKLDSDLVLFDAVRHIENGKSLNLIHFSKDNPTDFNSFSFDYEYTRDKVFDGYYGVIWNKFYKSSFIKDNRICFPKHKIYNDVEFHVKTMLLAKKIAYIPGIFYHYNRIGQDSIQNSYVSTRNSFVFFDVLENLFDFLKNNDFFNSFKEEFIVFSIFELRNKLKSVDDNLKQEFFEKSKKFFFYLDPTVDDLNNIPFGLFMHYLFIINSKDYANFKSNDSLESF